MGCDGERREIDECGSGDSSGLERNICQKMRKGENNYGKYNQRGIWIRIREHLQEN